MFPPLQFPLEIEPDLTLLPGRVSADQAHQRERTQLRADPGRVIFANNLERNGGTIRGIAVPAHQVQRMRADIRTSIPQKIPPDYEAVIAFG